MELNKYTGLRYILPVMHIMIIDNNYYLKKISIKAIFELIDVFNKYSKENGYDFEASFDREQLEEKFFPNYELDSDEKYIIIKNIARRRRKIKRLYLDPVLTVFGEIIYREGFMEEAKAIIDRERARQECEIITDKWKESCERRRFYKSKLDEAVQSGNNILINNYQKQLDRLDKEVKEYFLRKNELELISCNHLFVQTYRNIKDIEINRAPYFHRHDYEYRCVKCGLTNMVYLQGDREFYGPIGEIMYDITEKQNGVFDGVYNDLNNAYVISKPKVAEEIYNEIISGDPSDFIPNSEIIKELREKVEKREKGSSRKIGEKHGK